ncbi:hypothetical protein [Neisseria wadsworthii]|uniref:Uncharacterized protein n=1 Tax=Neisseria wadsworthii 9715 TaxID=1030841 RepID=G4CPF6_9NEIS|nr:hypothetical protein [Neisseria wadsworthii]EGZ47896.1 hypothetical protein HMPREF9370_0977 [Neisseria wadsworthii 9715]QMT34784.1 hypothetical protein H3L96_06750 [Neisseria wadsworthii]
MTETKFHVGHDGNSHGLFNSYDEAEIYILKERGWTDEEIKNDLAFAKKECSKYGGDLFADPGKMPLWFITEIEMEDGKIVKVDGQSYRDYLESIGGEEGSGEYEADLKRMNAYYLLRRS